MSETSNMYEFKMTLFENIKPEEFLLFQQIFQLTLDVSVTISDGEKSVFMYVATWISATTYWDTVYTNWSNWQHKLETNYFGDMYEFYNNALSFKNRMIRHGMIKLRRINIRFYVARMTYLNEYLSIFTVSNENIRMR